MNRMIGLLMLGVMMCTASCRRPESATPAEPQKETQVMAESQKQWEQPRSAKSPASQPGEAKLPCVALETSMGKIILELDSAKAPVTAANFLGYVQAGHYDGTVFHRVIPGFMVQGGGMTADMNEKSTRPPIPNEGGNGLKNHRGTVAMARTSDPNSATAQFFINVADNAFLDRGQARDGYGYAVFGQVVEGMDVVDKIVAVPTTTAGHHENVPVTPVVIQKAAVLP